MTKILLGSLLLFFVNVTNAHGEKDPNHKHDQRGHGHGHRSGYGEVQGQSHHLVNKRYKLKVNYIHPPKLTTPKFQVFVARVRGLSNRDDHQLSMASWELGHNALKYCPTYYMPVGKGNWSCGRMKSKPYTCYRTFRCLPINKK